MATGNGEHHDEEAMRLEAVDNAKGRIDPLVETMCRMIVAEFPPTHRNGHPCVPYDHVEELSIIILAIIADLVVEYIDAGSEREAVMENETLNDAITHELLEWTEKEV